MSDSLYKGQCHTLKLPVFVIGVLMLLVQVSCNMGGVSGPCSRNLVNANIFWDHGNITGITLIESFWIFLKLTTQRSLVNLQKMSWKIRTLWLEFSGEYIRFSHESLETLRHFSYRHLILKLDQCCTWRTDHINYKVPHQKDTAKKRGFHDSFFLAYFYPNKLCRLLLCC